MSDKRRDAAIPHECRCEVCGELMQAARELAPVSGSAKLSNDAKNALIWLTCSAEAAELTCKDARDRLSKNFGAEVATEIEGFFSPNAPGEPRRKENHE